MSRVGMPVSKPPGNSPAISKKRKGMGDHPPNGMPTGYPPYPQHYPQGPYGSHPPHPPPPHPYGPYAPQHQPPPPHPAHGPQQPPQPHYPPHANWPPNGPPPHHAPPHPTQSQSGGYGQPWGMSSHPPVYHPASSGVVNNPSSPDRPPQQWVNAADYHPGNNAPNLTRHHSPSRGRTGSPPPGSNTTGGGGGGGGGAWHSQQQWPPQTSSSQPPPRPQHPSARGGQPPPQSQPPNPTQSGGPPPNQSYGHPPPSSRGWNPSSSPPNGIEWSGGSVGGGNSHNGGVSSASTPPTKRTSPSSGRNSRGMGSKGSGGSQDGMGDMMFCGDVDSDAVEDTMSKSDKDSDKGRGSYRCGKCGVPKKGHVCPYQPKFKRRPDEPPPETRNASTQVEMDEFLVLRRLNLEIQGFPESYTSDPSNNVGAEPHRPHPVRSHGAMSPNGPSSMHQSSSSPMTSGHGMRSSGSPGMSTHSGGRGGEGVSGMGMEERRSPPLQQHPSEGGRRGEMVGRGGGVGGGCLPKDVRSSSTSPRNMIEGDGSRVN